MSCCDRRLLLLTGLALFIAACQPLPRPFKPEGDKNANPLLGLSDAGGVHVLNIDGAPSAASRRLAGAMASALQELNIPASTFSANGRSLFLQGSANTRRLAKRSVEVALRWELINNDGKTVGRHDQRTVLSDQAWRNAQPEPLEALAVSAAPSIAKLMQEPAPVGVPQTATETPIHVAPVTGAPGDGDTALHRAIKTTLARAGANVVDQPPKDGYVVVGKVAMGRPRAGRQNVRIVWSVRDADGTERGDIKQSNTIRAGELDGRWGDLAYLVAQGAADGVTDLLRKLSRSAARTDGSGSR